MGFISEEKWIHSGAGKRIYVRSARPETKRERFSTLILLPGGLGSGTPVVNGPWAEGLLSRGYAIVAFNPQGRGNGAPGDLRSQGIEDYNGFIHQDDLKAVIEAARDWSFVDAENRGLVSLSFGLSLAAGCLARHQGLGIKFLIDIEGPSDSSVIMCDHWIADGVAVNDRPETVRRLFPRPSLQRDASQPNSAWWREREALRFIGSLGVPFMRLQAWWDHMQPPNGEYPDGFDRPPVWYRNKHAVDLINAATLGNSPWTRMNDSSVGNKPNMLYQYDQQPLYYPAAFDFRSPDFSNVVGNAVDEMFALTAG